jgi:hypothetical protein
MTIAIAVLVSLVVGIGAGGYGGYRWGRSVEAKGQAVGAALKAAIKQ